MCKSFLYLVAAMDWHSKKELLDKVGSDLIIRPGLEHIHGTRLIFIGEGVDAERFKNDLDALWT